MRNREAVIQKLERGYGARLRAGLAKPGNESLTLDDIEKLVGELGRETLQQAAEELLRDEADSRQGELSEKELASEKHPCRRCHRLVRFRAFGPRTILTARGALTLENRRLYYCRRCDTDTAPVDEQLGLPGHGYTAKVEGMVAEVGADSPSESASAKLERLTGLSVSGREVQRIQLAVGEYAQAKEAEVVALALKARVTGELDSICEQLHDPKLTVYVGADGIHTPMRTGIRGAKNASDGTGAERSKHADAKKHAKRTKGSNGYRASKSYRESKVGCVYVVNQAGRVLQRHYVYHMGGPGEFGKKLYALMVSLGLAEMARIVVLADGASWIWNQVGIYFPDAIQVLDWFHVTEHLHEVAALCFPEQEAQEQATATAGSIIAAEQAVTDAADVRRSAEPLTKAKEWEKKMEGVMLTTGVEEVIREVKALPKISKDALNCIRRTANYLLKNAHRMNYREYRARGWMIGSGIVESAVKRVVAARMKGTGMRWTEAGARAMGALRAALLSDGRWDRDIATWRGRARAAIARS